jgi:hypothetical protein
MHELFKSLKGVHSYFTNFRSTQKRLENAVVLDVSRGGTTLFLSGQEKCFPTESKGQEIPAGIMFEK